MAFCYCRYLLNYIKLIIGTGRSQVMSEVEAKMSPNLHVTKLFILPVCPNLGFRPRLVHRPDGGLNPSQKLILVSTLAGYGKITFVTERQTSVTRRASEASRKCRLQSAGLVLVNPHALNASRMRRCKMMESCRFIGASTCKLLSYTYRVSVHEEQADREDPNGDQDRDSPGGVDAKSNPDQAE